MHFWEITTLQFEKKTPQKALYFKAFYEYYSSIIFEKCVVTPNLFSFWISTALVKIYFSFIIINRGKNTFELVGTVLNMYF